MNTEPSQPTALINEYQEILNRHGYGFQYSLIKIVDELTRRPRSSWVFEAAEFPVEIQGRGTRIDFVLSCHHSPIFIVAECKRVNPAMANWCFAQAPYVQQCSSYKNAFVERIELKDTIIRTSTKRSFISEEPYHVTLEVKSDRKGDSSGGKPEAIEDAATQVCRGVNGLIKCLSANSQLVPSQQYVHLLPVIFTTADLWASEVDLSSADIKDGKVNLSDADFKQKNWLFYQYHLSPGLKHSFSSEEKQTTLGGFMETEYVRTIAVVNSKSAAQFLDWAGAQTFV